MHLPLHLHLPLYLHSEIEKSRFKAVIKEINAAFSA